MSVYLTNNPLNPAASNTLRPGDGRWQYFEKSYSGAGAQEWIYTPDVPPGIVGLVVQASGAATVEVTCSPPDVIESGSPLVVDSGAASISATTKWVVFPANFTAFRINNASGTTKVSAMV